MGRGYRLTNQCSCLTFPTIETDSGSCVPLEIYYSTVVDTGALVNFVTVLQTAEFWCAPNDR